MKNLQTSQEKTQLESVNSNVQELNSIDKEVSYSANYTTNYENGYDSYGSNTEGTESIDREETDLEPKNQTARVHSYNKKNGFKLRDAKGKIITADGLGEIEVREGIEVVHLKNTCIVDEEVFQEIIVWLEGAYYKGFIPAGAIEGEDENNKIKSRDLLNAFLNDLEHGVFRAEKRMEHASRGRFDGMGLGDDFLDGYEQDIKESYAQFFKLKEEVWHYVSLLG